MHRNYPEQIFLPLDCLLSWVQSKYLNKIRKLHPKTLVIVCWYFFEFLQNKFSWIWIQANSSTIQHIGFLPAALFCISVWKSRSETWFQLACFASVMSTWQPNTKPDYEKLLDPGTGNWPDKFFSCRSRSPPHSNPLIATNKMIVVRSVRIFLKDGLIDIPKYKYGSVQQLRSIFGHLKFIQISLEFCSRFWIGLDWSNFGFVFSNFIRQSLVGFSCFWRS